MEPVHRETRGSFRGQFVVPSCIAIALGSSCFAGAATAQTEITPAPAFNSERLGSYAVSLPLEPPVDNVPYFGGSLGQSSAPDRGIFAALDVTTNRLVWRQQWTEPCYSGSVVTAGGLVFTGHSDGRLMALDKTNGALLWEFMTDAGVNSTITTFDHQGELYVVVHAGGGVFANGARGDGIWMFSLNGTIEPVLTGLTVEAAVAVSAAGRNNMPAFRDSY